MSDNRGLVYLGPANVEVQNIDDPKLALDYKGNQHDLPDDPWTLQ